jgi:hypothetical protein
MRLFRIFVNPALVLFSGVVFLALCGGSVCAQEVAVSSQAKAMLDAWSVSKANQVTAIKPYLLIPAKAALAKSCLAQLELVDAAMRKFVAVKTAVPVSSPAAVTAAVNSLYTQLMKLRSLESSLMAGATTTSTAQALAAALYQSQQTAAVALQNMR